MAAEMLAQRRGHLPVLGVSQGGWNRPRWGLEGYDPAVSIYDQDFGADDSNLHQRVRDGIMSLLGRLPVSEPTMTREGRVSAQHNTLPAARFFQSYTGAGTGRNWSAATTAFTHHSMNMNANPGAAGAAELHPATSYQPFPSPAELYPKVV